MRHVRVANATRNAALGSRVAVADRWWLRLRGLLGRPQLATGEGLLLEPCRAVHMLGMSYPLDVAFVDESDTVIALYHGLAPRARTRWHPARYALELPAGTLERSGTDVGDKLSWGGSHGGTDTRSARVGNRAQPVQERMNSPLDLREDRLRGLCLQPTLDRTVPAGDFAWFQRRIHSLLERRTGFRRSTRTSYERQRGALRFLLGLVLALMYAGALPAAAQSECPATSRAEPPHLDAFSLLFRQNGVSFHARVETDPGTAGGRLVIGNGNPYDVELTYDVVVAGSVGAETAEGKCVRIRAREYAVDTDAGTVIRYEKGTPTGVRVRNLRMTRVEPAPSADAAVRAAAAPSAAPAQLTQYRCGEGGTPGQRACSTAFMAAAARAAAESGRFAGVTRECLLEYATAQETAANLIRASDARGDSLRLTTPSCYSRGEARWGYEELAAACPRGEWTSANAGRVDCAARAAAPAPPPVPDPVRASETEADFRRALTIALADAVLRASPGASLRPVAPPAPEPSVSIPHIISTILTGIIMVAMTAAGALLLLPVLSATCLSLAWGAQQLVSHRDTEAQR